MKTIVIAITVILVLVSGLAAPLLAIATGLVGAYTIYRIIRGVVDPEWLETNEEQSFGLEPEQED